MLIKIAFIVILHMLPVLLASPNTAALLLLLLLLVALPAS
jgi:hypothetical protein